MITLPIPPGSRALFLALVLVCLACAGGCAAISLMGMQARHAALNAANAVLVRVLSPEAADLERAAAILRADASAIASAEPMSAEDAEALLSQSGVRAPEGLPAPRLIVAQAREPGAATPAFAQKLRSDLAEQGISAETFADTAAPLRALEDARVWRAWSMLGLAAAAAMIGMSAYFLGRARAAALSRIAPVLADLGATRGQVAHYFSAEATWSAFAAGVVGSILAVAAGAAWLSFAPSGAMPLETALSLITPLDAAALAGAPAAAALFARLGAGAEGARAQKLAAVRL